MKKIALPLLEGFLFACLLLISCQSEPTEEVPPPVESPQQQYDLKVATATGRLKAEAGPHAATLRELEKGSPLLDLDVVSNFTTQIRFGEESADEPWLKVQSPDGQVAWIYARDVVPIDPKVNVVDFRRKKQLQSMFGSAVASWLQQYGEEWETAKTAEALAILYDQGLDLRDTLLPPLEHRSTQYTGQSLPDLFWVDQYLPGYVAQLIADNSMYYLFNDYKQWLKKAESSNSTVDDRFFNLMIKCYPQDSIEFFTPAWEVPSSSFGTHNLLGRGLVYSILADVEQLQSQTTLFSAPLLKLKGQLLAGITASNPHFWEADSLVIQEMDSIIKQNWSIFTATDRIALDARRMQLDSAEIHGIRFNARAGK